MVVPSIVKVAPSKVKFDSPAIAFAPVTVTTVLLLDPVKVGPAPVNPLPSPINDAAVTIPEKVAFPPDLMVAALPTLKFPDASMVILGSPFVPNVNELTSCEDIDAPKPILILLSALFVVVALPTAVSYTHLRAHET